MNNYEHTMINYTCPKLLSEPCNNLIPEEELSTKNRYLLYKIILLILFISFAYVHPMIKMPFGNVSAIRLDDIIWLPIFLYWIFRYRPISTIINASLTIPIIIYIFICGFSLLWNYVLTDGVVVTRPLVYGTFFFTKLLQYFSIYYMVSSVTWSDRDILLAMRALFLMGIFVSVMGTLQHLGVLNLRYDPTIPQNSRHVTSTLSFNYAHLGAFQLVTSTFALALLHEAKSISGKLFYGSFLFIFLYILMLSGSRAACIGTVVALGVYFIYSDQKITVLGIISLGLVVFMVVGMPEYIVKRLEGGFGSGETGAGRVKSWMNLPDYFNSSALDVPFGVGFMRFKFSAIDYFHSTAGHNNFLNAYVETGIFGLFSFCFLLISIFRKAKERLSTITDGRSKYFRLAYLSSFVGLTTTCLSMETFSVVLAFTSFLGFFMFLSGVFVGNRQY